MKKDNDISKFDTDKKYSKYTKNGILLIIILLFILAFFTDNYKDDNNLNCSKILIFEDFDTDFSQKIKSNESKYNVKIVSLYDTLSKFWDSDVVAVSTDEIQAKKMLSLNKNLYWYPMYETGIVIAMDKKYSNFIKSFEDIENSKLKVIVQDIQLEQTVISMAHSFGDKDYSLKSTMKFLRKIYLNANLMNLKNSNFYDEIKSDNMQASIIFLHIANKLDKDRVTIQFPKEGGIIFTYGILSKKPLEFLENIDFKVVDFPENFEKISNIKAYDKAYEMVTPYFRRQVKLQRLYTSAYGVEHLMSYLIIMSIIIFWGYAIYMRIADVYIKKYFLIIVITMIFMIFSRFLRFIIPKEIIYYRYLIYSLYISHAIIPYCSVKIAFNYEKDNKKLDRIYLIDKIVAGFIILGALSNDVFHLLYKYRDYDSYINPKYSIIYYITVIYVIVNISAFIIKMILTSKNMPNKLKSALPMVPVILYLIYMYGYYRKIEFFTSSESVTVYIIICLLFFETCFISGFFSGTSRYLGFLNASKLNMVIVDNYFNPQFETKVKADNDMILKAYNEIKDKDSFYDVYYNDNEIMSGKKVTGGYAVWWKDISKVKSLERELKIISDSLDEDIKLLKEQEKIESRLYATKWKNEIYEEIESNINEGFEKIEKFYDDYIKNRYVGRVDEFLIDISYYMRILKRKINIMLIGKISENIRLSELVISIKDSGKPLNICPDIVIGGEGDKKLVIWMGILIYDLATELMYFAFEKDCLINAINIRIDGFRYRVMFYFDDIIDIYISENIKNRILAMNGRINIDIDDIAMETTFMLILNEDNRVDD